MSEPICCSEHGQLRGLHDTDIDDVPFMSFLGIPYAKPPLGELRFRPPQPLDKWQGIRNATKEGPPCYSSQIVIGGMFSKQKIKGSEDCLYLNVYTRKLRKTTKQLKPVMVWIHGWGFFSGSSSSEFFGPHYLMIEDIVLVTFNYRIGVLGFLSMDDPFLGVTGNAGLKDQVMVLRWVQTNIKNFGGDPLNVTIFGQSAGSVDVNLLLLSPSAKGLFHKAIMQSGVIMCPWARGTNNYIQLAQELGCKDVTNKQILQCFLNAPVKSLVEAENRLILKHLDVSKPALWGPHIETKQYNKRRFIDTEPFEVMTSSYYHQVPIMMGYTSLEGIFDTWGFFRMYKKLRNFVPDYFGGGGGEQQTLKVNRKIRKFYFADHQPSVFKRLELAKVLTDVEFLRPILFAVKTFVKTSQHPVYFYRMSIETKLNVFTRMLWMQNRGVCHADDCFYLFSSKYTSVKKDTIEDLAVRRFVRLWANFARSGNPTPKADPLLGVEWKPATWTEVNFLNIDQELTMGVNPDEDRMQFWDSVSHLAQNKQYLDMLKFSRH